VLHREEGREKTEKGETLKHRQKLGSRELAPASSSFGEQWSEEPGVEKRVISE
jgi:hypothetical protein